MFVVLESLAWCYGCEHFLAQSKAKSQRSREREQASRESRWAVCPWFLSRLIFVRLTRSAVLNSSSRAPAPPPLCTFRMLLLLLQKFVLFERKCPAKWTSQDIPTWFQFEANLYSVHPFKVHWSVRDVNLNCIYLQRYMMSHSSVREYVAQCKSMNESSEVK